MSDNAESRALRQRLAEAGAHVVSLIAGPRSGKTSIVLATIDALRDEFNIAVVQGDVSSTVDAGRIRAQGIPAVQVHEVGEPGLCRAIGELDLDRLDLVVIEALDEGPGWGATVAVLSAAEGMPPAEGCPDIVGAADAVVVNKVDSAGAGAAGLPAWEAAIRARNPHAPIFPMSATKGEGVDGWAAWLAGLIR